MYYESNVEGMVLPEADDMGGGAPPPTSEVVSRNDPKDGFVTALERAKAFGLVLALNECDFHRLRCSVCLTALPRYVAEQITDLLREEFCPRGVVVERIGVRASKSTTSEEMLFQFRAYAAAYTAIHRHAIVVVEGAQNIRGIKRAIREMQAFDAGLTSLVILGTHDAIVSCAEAPANATDAALAFRCAWNEARLMSAAYSVIEKSFNRQIDEFTNITLSLRWGHCLEPHQVRVAREVFDSVLGNQLRPEVACNAIVHAANGSIDAMAALTHRLAFELRTRATDCPLDLRRFLVRAARYGRLMNLHGDTDHLRHAHMNRAVDRHWTTFFEAIRRC